MNIKTWDATFRAMSLVPDVSPNKRQKSSDDVVTQKVKDILQFCNPVIQKQNLQKFTKSIEFFKLPELSSVYFWNDHIVNGKLIAKSYENKKFAYIENVEVHLEEMKRKVQEIVENVTLFTKMDEYVYWVCSEIKKKKTCNIIVPALDKDDDDDDLYDVKSYHMFAYILHTIFDDHPNITFSTDRRVGAENIFVDDMSFSGSQIEHLASHSDFEHVYLIRATKKAKNMFVEEEILVSCYVEEDIPVSSIGSKSTGGMVFTDWKLPDGTSTHINLWNGKIFIKDLLTEDCQRELDEEMDFDEMDERGDDQYPFWVRFSHDNLFSSDLAVYKTRAMSEKVSGWLTTAQAPSSEP